MTNKNLKAEPINDALKEHALTLAEWSYRELFAWLHEWAERFNSAFCLGLQVPLFAICRIRVTSLGTYHRGRNPSGLRHQITLNSQHLDRPPAQVLGVLLHELIHEWQALYGKADDSKRKGNYHNIEFRIKGKSLGLITDERGHDLGIEPGPFTILLDQHGIDTGTLAIADSEHRPVFVKRLRGSSKLKRWTCPCGINARIARANWKAQCLECGGLYECTED